MTAKSFSAEIYAGHTTDCGAIVPFDPSKVWRSAPTLPLGYRKHVGYAVRGTLEGEAFESWVFLYHKQWRLIVPGAAMKAAKLGPGDTAEFAVQPHPEPETAPKFKPGPKRRSRLGFNRTAAPLLGDRLRHDRRRSRRPRHVQPNTDVLVAARHRLREPDDQPVGVDAAERISQVSALMMEIEEHDAPRMVQRHRGIDSDAAQGRRPVLPATIIDLDGEGAVRGREQLGGHEGDCAIIHRPSPRRNVCRYTSPACRLTPSV